ncbi:MAG: acyl-CoA dehydrogenase family protein [Alphaproteobacteria bacterium]
MSEYAKGFAPTIEGHTALQSLTRAIVAAASDDDERAFPAATFSVLRRHGILAPARTRVPSTLPLLRLQAAVGRGDLGTGRIFEGHVNALDLIGRFGTAAHAADAYGDAAAGHLFAVWNTDAPGHPLTVAADGDRLRLNGAKSFASGVDGVTRALVTASDQQRGRVMLLLPLEPDRERVDRSWWRPLGMRNSVSHMIDLDGRIVTSGQVVGTAGDYLRQPWFGAGAIRFAAVQVGGMHAVFDAAREHLVGAGRASAPYQRHRLAQMAMAVESGYGWLDRAAAAWDRGCRGAIDADSADAAAAVAYANLTRSAVEEFCMRVVELAQRAVGCAGLIEPHPLERRLRDLMVYLRQPDPDGALAQAGDAVAEAALEPGGW